MSVPCRSLCTPILLSGLIFSQFPFLSDRRAQKFNQHCLFDCSMGATKREAEQSVCAQGVIALRLNGYMDGQFRPSSSSDAYTDETSRGRTILQFDEPIQVCLVMSFDSRRSHFRPLHGVGADFCPQLFACVSAILRSSCRSRDVFFALASLAND